MRFFGVLVALFLVAGNALATYPAAVVVAQPVRVEYRVSAPQLVRETVQIQRVEYQAQPVVVERVERVVERQAQAVYAAPVAVKAQVIHAHAQPVLAGLAVHAHPVRVQQVQFERRGLFVRRGRSFTVIR